MAKAVVVSGARGFVGAATVRKLATLPETTVVAVARSRPDDGGCGSPVQWIESSLETLTKEHWSAAGVTAIDAVVHLAAFTPKTAAMRDSAQEIISSNVVGTQALFASLPCPPRRLIFCSTLDVYSRLAFEGVIDERSPVGPVGLYGLSKLLGEGLAESYARSCRAEHVTLRLGHVFGPGEERYAKLVPETIRRVRLGKPPRIAGTGGERRDLLYVDDAAEALARACTATLGEVRTINIARGESHSILEIVNTIASLAGYHGGMEWLQQPANAHSTLFDTSLMRDVLGDWTMVSLVEGLRREIADFTAAI